MTYSSIYGKIKYEPFKKVYEVKKVKDINRKIKLALIILMVCLIAFVGFSKAGILFSAGGKNVITVSTTKKTFDPNSYVASVAMVDVGNLVEETTTSMFTTTTTTTKVQTTTTTTTTTKKTLPATTWTGAVLTKSKGAIIGPSGKETYYNLNMSVVVNAMRRLGYTEEEYPYWVREDGVKMLGNYVMVAASYDIRPKGTILESSLGMAIVCDTGSFTKNNQTQLDIAVSW